MLLYHHCIDLEYVVFDEISRDESQIRSQTKNKKDIVWDNISKMSYRWLEREVGFYPLFLAVGTTGADIRMTGYQCQWRVKIVDALEKKSRVYRKAGEFPNYVLFSFENVDGIFTDFDMWNILVLNSAHKEHQIPVHEKKRVFKPSWTKADWLRKARRDPDSVQLVTPKLYLPDARRIWVRNKPTKERLEEMGFENVDVRRIALEGHGLSGL
jgi:hypothetical protein